jgi:KDO2-lipid IV(A) lauroyltransferase
MRRVGRGYYSVGLSVIAEPPYDEVEDIQIVEQYARNLERDIRESPWDWLWLQKKWKIKRGTVSAEPATKPAAAP